MFLSAFTVYIYLILNYSDFVPCSCGGILEKLGWTEHLIFNGICVIMGVVAIIRTVKNRTYGTSRAVLFLLTSIF